MVRQARRHGQNAPDLVTARHWRQLLWFLEVPDLGCEIVPARTVTRTRKFTPVMIRLCKSRLIGPSARAAGVSAGHAAQ
jgi:hypothetical protein